MTPKPRNLTEETPESQEDFQNRGLLLDSGEAQVNPQGILTEDLPQEEGEGGPGLLTED